MLQRMFSILFNKSGQQSGPSMDGMLAMMDRHLDYLDDLILPDETANPRTPFDSDVPFEEASLANLGGRDRLRIIPKMVPLFLNMQLGARMYDRRFQPTRDEATPDFIAALETLARASGVADIKYVKVPRSAIFRGKGIPHEYAIVFTVEMDREPINTSPSFDSQLEVMRGYKNMAVIANKLTRFLRKNGYAAYPGTALGGITDYNYLAELAGLGANGYHGMLITPHEGTRLRINTIYTNITNLPIETENEHLWVRDFCAMCRKCIRQCPVDAIHDQPEPRDDGGMQCIDHATCREYFTRNYGCAVCLAGCPFSQAGYDAIKARFKGNPDAPQFRLPQMPAPVEAHTVGYGELSPAQNNQVLTGSDSERFTKKAKKAAAR
jgi:epoxyqueuosine reductase